jgi:hypothetical protein
MNALHDRTKKKNCRSREKETKTRHISYKKQLTKKREREKKKREENGGNTNKPNQTRKT